MKNYRKLIIIATMSTLVYGAKNTPNVKTPPNTKSATNKPVSEKSTLNGFAIGIQAGYTTVKALAKFSTRSANTFSKTNFEASGFLGGMLLGIYSDVGTSMNLGLDVQYSMSNASGVIDNFNLGVAPSKLTLKVKDQLTAAVRLGWRIDKVVPYLKVGVVSSALEGRVTVPSASPAVKKHRYTGLLGGGGVDFCLDGCTTLGVEGTVAKYSTLKITEPTNSYTYTLKPMAFSTAVVVKCFF